MRQHSIVKTTLWWKQVLGWFFPDRCPLCAVSVSAYGQLCSDCWSGVEFITDPACSKCGLPLPYDMGSHALCASCIQRMPSYNAARAAFRYDEQSRDLVLGLKFSDRTEMLESFGQWLARAASGFPAPDYILPVPLHPRRLRERKYNQAVLLARALAKASGHRLLPDGMQRLRATMPQSGLNYAQRMENVKSAFAPHPRYKAMLADATVWLVDDVMTTSATIMACTDALLKAGAKAVYVITLARTARDES
jgi:ComF family protein